MQSFKERFEAYGGDYETTMGRFMGNQQMYRRFLGMLFEDKSMSQLGGALAAGDLRGAFEAAHTLKGVAGNMGLTPLYDAVRAITEPLRAGEMREDYPVLYKRIEEEFQRIRGELLRPD